MPKRNPVEPVLRTWSEWDADLQVQAAVAVVIPTILRPTLAQALTSVFAQEFDGRVQILVGIDQPQGSIDVLEATCRMAPSHCIVQALYPGYSTSVRHGGTCDACDGGALRTVLSYLANAPLIAYLDDDNWWGPRHLATLVHAIAEVDDLVVRAEQSLQCPCATHQPGEVLCCSPTGDRSDAHFGLTENRPITGKAHIAAQNELAARAAHPSGDRGDRHLSQRADPAEQRTQGGTGPEARKFGS